ncbi:unnamed protein product [Trichogramma brassicae]|uniref:Uncharacterized protein n=1 Tax=Trichogramma brassicae TaxID=86971 RepID=A0A6H5IMM1_9HYME|nr:unnamed protein product [Trichogramma brassicae]
MGYTGAHIVITFAGSIYSGHRERMPDQNVYINIMKYQIDGRRTSTRDSMYATRQGNDLTLLIYPSKYKFITQAKIIEEISKKLLNRRGGHRLYTYLAARARREMYTIELNRSIGDRLMEKRARAREMEKGEARAESSIDHVTRGALYSAYNTVKREKPRGVWQCVRNNNSLCVYIYDSECVGDSRARLGH